MQYRVHGIISFASLLLLCTAPRATSQLFLETIYVHAVDTVPKQSQVLQLGKRYDLICSGTFSFWRNAQGDSVGLVDAAYYRDIPPGEFGFPGLSTSTTNGFLLNGQPISGRIDPPGMSPTYTYRVPFTGLGAPATLYIEDKPPFSIDRHDDNTGMIRVDIYNVSPEIDIDTGLIDFGEVELGEFRDTVITFRNIGYGPLRVSNLTISGADAAHYSLNALPHYLLDVGDSASFTLRFTPTSVFRKDAVLEMNTNDSDVPLLRISLTGVGVTTLEAGFDDMTYARAQEYIVIPVLLKRNREGSETTTFAMDISYDPHLLYPIGWTSDGTLSSGHSMAVDITRPGSIVIRGNGGPAISGTGPLLYLRCIALWHEPNSTPLEVMSLTFNAGNPRSLASDGVLVVDSLCNQYLKTISFGDAPQLRQNHPNPFNPTTVISFILPAAQHVRLDIHNATGQHIRTLHDGILREGKHDLPFLASGLPSGLYLYTLHSRSGSQTRSMLLLR
jgi:hypothetical protein